MRMIKPKLKVQVNRTHFSYIGWWQLLLSLNQRFSTLYSSVQMTRNFVYPRFLQNCSDSLTQAIINYHQANIILPVYLPFLLEFLATIAIALAIRGESLGLLSGTTGSPDAVYVRILVPFAIRLMFNSKLCFCAVIRAFALETIILCSRCVWLLWLFGIRAWSGTGTARGTGVTALAARECFISLIMYEWYIANLEIYLIKIVVDIVVVIK